MDTLHDAMWWRKEDQIVICELCPHFCNIPEGKRGFCGVRFNYGSSLKTLNFGKASSVAIDPIEKKPLYHWFPGSRILSFGTVGCNLNCPFCQNWPIARWADSVDLIEITPQKIVELVKKNGLKSVAFTYNEPFVWFEFVLKSAQVLRKENIHVVLVTNGYINAPPLRELLPYISAMNIDLKGFSEKVYSILHGSLEPVKRTIETSVEAGVHVEITHLLVPGIHDSTEQFVSMIDWLSSISANIPFHLSRYFPNYKWHKEPTPLDKMKEYADLAREKLKFVYLGNILEGNDTFCPKCNALIIKRTGYHIEIFNLKKDGRCGLCNTRTGIVTN